MESASYQATLLRQEQGQVSMTLSTVHCSHCGKINSSHRVWCAHCQASLPSQRKLAREAGLSQEDAERRDLYRSVLNDLGQLVYAGRADSTTAEAVGTFYRTQLATIETRERELKRTAALDERIMRIRDAAQRGRYRQALDELKSVAREFPTSTMPGLIEAEVQCRLNREETARLDAAAKKLALESQASVEQSKQHEKESEPTPSAVQPSSESKPVSSLSTQEQTTASSTTVEPVIAEAELVSEQSGRSTTQPCKPIEPSDEIVVAQLAGVPDEPDSTVKRDFPAHPITPATVEKEPSQRQSISDGPELVASEASRHVVAVASKPRADAVHPEHSKLKSRSFEEHAETPSPTQRLINSASHWSSLLKPFLIDNVGWFVGGFLLIAGFVVLIVTFWSSIEQNRVLMHSLVYLSLAATTGVLFSMAYFMRVRYPQLETSSNVLLVLVSLLIPLVFAAAVLTMLVPAAPVDAAVSAMLR